MMLKGRTISGSVSRTTEHELLLLYYFLLRAPLLLGRNNPKEIELFELYTSSLLKQNSCLINKILVWVICSLWNLQESPISAPQTWCSNHSESVGYSFSSFVLVVLLCSLSLSCRLLVTAIFSTIYSWQSWQQITKPPLISTVQVLIQAFSSKFDVHSTIAGTMWSCQQRLFMFQAYFACW